jgi:hypothetical protein
MTLSDSSAMSGATAASPSPVTMMRGGGCVSAAAAAVGKAIAAARPSAIRVLFIKGLRSGFYTRAVSPDYGLIAAGAGRISIRRTRLAKGANRSSGNGANLGAVDTHIRQIPVGTLTQLLYRFPVKPPFPKFAEEVHDLVPR